MAGFRFLHWKKLNILPLNIQVKVYTSSAMPFSFPTIRMVLIYKMENTFNNVLVPVLTPNFSRSLEWTIQLLTARPHFRMNPQSPRINQRRRRWTSYPGYCSSLASLGEGGEVKEHCNLKCDHLMSLFLIVTDKVELLLSSCVLPVGRLSCVQQYREMQACMR